LALIKYFEDKMIIHVREFANFRDILGKDLRLELKDKSTVKDILDNGKVREYVILKKNRKDVDSLDGLKTMLSEGYEVAILPPIAGG
jgi:molybdopterin converting factor small subunit